MGRVTIYHGHEAKNKMKKMKRPHLAYILPFASGEIGVATEIKPYIRYAQQRGIQKKQRPSY